MQLQSIEHKNESQYEKLETALLAAALAAGTLCWFMTGMGLTLGKGGLFGGGLRGGMIFLWNETADFLGNSHFLQLTRYEGSGEGCGLFLLLTWLLLAGVSYGILHSRKVWLLLIYLIPFFTAQMIWDIKPQAWAAGLLLWAVFTAAVRPVLFKSGRLLTAMLLLCIIGAAAWGTAMVTEDGEAGFPAIDKLSARMHENLEQIRYKTNPRGDGSLEPQAFDQEGTALEIKMEHPDSLYLRGFVGSEYRNGRWQSLACSEYYQQSGLFYWLHRKGFSGLTQMKQVQELLGGKQEGAAVQVTNKSASRKYLYLPYETVQADMPDTKNWSDSFLTATGLRGAESYRLQALPNMVKDWPALSAQLFTRKNGEDLQQYRIKESHYNVQQYEDYTELTAEQIRLLAQYIGAAGNQEKGHIDYKKAINTVHTYLEENFIYTERLSKQAEGEKGSRDPIEGFFQSKKGCDVHYASAAALMFRYYGIPARYVEGYIITPEDIEGKKPGDVISLPGKNNHAWTEIYIDSFGWVPLEATPQYYDKMEQPDLSKGLENQSMSDAWKQYERQKSTEQTDTDPESRPEDDSLWWKMITALLIFDFLAAVLAGLITKLIQRLVAVRRRQRAFRNPDVRMAVCALYAYMRSRKVPLAQEAAEAGERAAYSLHKVTEQDRQIMLRELERMKREKHEKKRNRHLHGSHSGSGRRRLRRGKQQQSAGYPT